MGNDFSNSQDLPKPPNVFPSPSAIPVKPPVPPIPLPSGAKVIDLYHGDCEGQTIDFAKAYAHGGVEGLYHKASEASSMQDMTMASRLKLAKMANIKIGAYHFFRGNVDGAAQAANYLKAIAGLTLDMAPILDWESTDGASREDHIIRARVWLDMVEKATGRVPMIYMNLAQANFLKLPQSFTRYPLIFARYIAEKPAAPSPWPSYVMWQNSETGDVSGIPDKCDTNFVS